ncbi:MAG: EF-hand domain-containing protein [Verrucomicrobiota bacterium]
MNIGGLGGIGGSFSPEEIQNKMFNRVDKNQDGGISKDELAAMKRGQHGPSADEVFAKFDTNEDGLIDKAEHKELAKEMRAKMEEKLEQARSQGLLSGDQLDKFLEMLTKADEENADSQQKLFDSIITQLQERAGETYGQDGQFSPLGLSSFKFEA